MNLFNSPALFLVVAMAIGAIWPLVSARIVSTGFAQKYPEVEGLITLVGSILTGLAAELLHASAGNGVDFSWRAWAATAASTIAAALASQSLAWRGSATAANLRAKGSSNNMHTDATPPA